MKALNVYKGIRTVGIGLIFASLFWSFYKGTDAETHSGGPDFTSAVGFYSDEKYEAALQSYEKSIREYPGFIHAKRGKARTLMQLGFDKKALIAFNEVLDQDPNSAVSFAISASLTRELAADRFSILTCMLLTVDCNLF